MLTVKAVDGSLSVFIGGQECKAEASDFSVLPFDDDILGGDREVSAFEELNDLVRSDFPWQSSHLDSSVAVAVVESGSQLDVLELGPNRRRESQS